MLWEFPSGSAGQGSSVVTAMALVTALVTAVVIGLIPSLGTSACCRCRQKKQNKKPPKILLCFWLVHFQPPHANSLQSKHTWRSSHCGSVDWEPSVVSVRMQVWCLALLNGLRIWCCFKLWHRSQMPLGSIVAMAVAQAYNCRSNSTPSLGTSICCRYGHKQKKNSIPKAFLFFFFFKTVSLSHCVPAFGSLPNTSDSVWLLFILSLCWFSFGWSLFIYISSCNPQYNPMNKI